MPSNNSDASFIERMLEQMSQLMNSIIDFFKQSSNTSGVKNGEANSHRSNFSHFQTNRKQTNSSDPAEKERKIDAATSRRTNPSSNSLNNRSNISGSHRSKQSRFSSGATAEPSARPNQHQTAGAKSQGEASATAARLGSNNAE